MFAVTILASGCWTAGVAQGYRDITADALLNPSFELSDASTALTAPTATNISETYGWTLPAGTSNMAVADATTAAIGFTNSKGGVRPADGSYFLWYRKGWGNLSTVVSTTTRPLAAGKYYVEVDYKAADYSNNNKHTTNGTKLSIAVTTTAGQALGQSSDARRAYSFANGSSNPGSDTYLVTAPWTHLGTFFTVTEQGEAILSIRASLVNNGRSDICLDNVRLYRLDDEAADGQTAFPLDVTGTLANPSFEAGAGGTSWNAYSYNGWDVARSSGDVRADGGTYAEVFGEQLDGLRVFNAWGQLVDHRQDPVAAGQRPARGPLSPAGHRYRQHGLSVGPFRWRQRAPGDRDRRFHGADRGRRLRQGDRRPHHDWAALHRLL